MEQRISIERLEQAINLFGSFDENIRLIESEFHVTVANREGELRVNGEPEDTMLACKALSALLTLSNRGEAINEQNVRYVIGLARSGQEEKIGELTQDVICISAKGRPIKPKTIGQKEYVDSISQNTVTIGVGPAGTGKTYLAVAAAVAAFRERKINRIILTLSEVSRARQHRGRASRLYARPHARRQLHHSRRGAEHLLRADENVPYPHGLRLENGHYRRRDADRPARR